MNDYNYIQKISTLAKSFNDNVLSYGDFPIADCLYSTPLYMYLKGLFICI